MKKILFPILVLCTLATSVFAASTTSSVRTSTGQIVSIGDSYISMVDRFQQSPINSRSYEYKDTTGKYTATEYTYLVDNTYYTITIVNNEIKTITWDRRS